MSCAEISSTDGVILVQVPKPQVQTASAYPRRRALLSPYSWEMERQSMGKGATNIEPAEPSRVSEA